MLYTHENARGAKVFDVEALAELTKVASVNTDTGEVECFRLPVRVNAAGDGADSFMVRFATIYPIQGEERMPCLFHCYGRLA